MTRRRRGRRGGYVLVLVALMLVGLFGLAALTIDLGLARATQVSMQTAADAAALEGLRGRDDLGWTDDALQTPGVAVDATARDAARRGRASALVAVTFDDDLDPSNGDALALGAGPVLGHDAGTGDWHASQLLTVDADPAARVYDPRLEANAGDDEAGDLLAGAWRGDDDPSSPRAEGADYARADLIPRPVAAASADAGIAAESSSAFLARLRRSPDLLGLDELPGISSRGPALPFLFGLGTTIHQAPSGAYDPREHGITVRATAIADARPALVVGPSAPAGGEPRLGLAPFTLDEAAWTEAAAAPHRFPVDTPRSVFVVGGELRWDAADPATKVGQATTTAPPGDVTAVVVGMSLPLYLAHDTLRGEGYVAITRAGVVVGFGWATVTEAGAALSARSSLTITKRVGRVAPSNASAVAHARRPLVDVPLALPSPPFAARHALLAPALVR